MRPPQSTQSPMQALYASSIGSVVNGDTSRSEMIQQMVLFALSSLGIGVSLPMCLTHGVLILVHPIT